MKRDERGIVPEIGHIAIAQLVSPIQPIGRAVGAIMATSKGAPVDAHLASAHPWTPTRADPAPGWSQLRSAGYEVKAHIALVGELEPHGAPARCGKRPPSRSAGLAGLQ